MGETNGRSLTYGEVEFSTMAGVFKAIEEKYGGMPTGGEFYDLGSGTGKGVISAALLHPFERVYGVEILQNLVNASLELVELYNSIVPTRA